jgi:hypothetical protein
LLSWSGNSHFLFIRTRHWHYPESVEFSFTLMLSSHFLLYILRDSFPRRIVTEISLPCVLHVSSILYQINHPKYITAKPNGRAVESLMVNITTVGWKDHIVFEVSNIRTVGESPYGIRKEEHWVCGVESPYGLRKLENYNCGIGYRWRYACVCV